VVGGVGSAAFGDGGGEPLVWRPGNTPAREDPNDGERVRKRRFGPDDVAVGGAGLADGAGVHEEYRQ